MVITVFNRIRQPERTLLFVSDLSVRATLHLKGRDMHSGLNIRTTDCTSRHGAAHVLIAAMLFAFIVTAAMTVDFAYMQLIRTELRTATDAAAKAGTEALGRTQNSDQARAAAVAYAAANKVGGKAMQIRTSDVKLGRVTGQNNGTWSFQENATPLNAVRVDSKIGNSGLMAAIPMFFAPSLGQPGFATTSQATAGQQEVEVCLCLDRSGSMMFNMTGNDWSYASSNPLLYKSSYYPSTMYRNYCSPPHPSASRWAVLMSAVTTFLNEAGQFQYPPRTALVTWSNAMTLPYYPNRSYNTVDTNFDLPSAGNFVWSSNRASVESSLATLTSNPIGGGTNLSSGLDRAVAVLTSPNGRSLSNKVIILMTDGDWNAGRNPVAAAQDAAAIGITVHCVSMLTSAQATLTQVAQITGGQYYATQNATQLQQAFQDLARQLPIVLTD